MQCATCKHFVLEKEDDDVGFCKRYPPTAALDQEDEVVCFYPTVALDDGCWEYLPR